MILRTRGEPSNIDKPLVGVVTRRSERLHERSVFISDIHTKPRNDVGLATLCTGSDLPTNPSGPIVSGIPQLSHLNEGDIVCVDTDGNIQTLYRVNSEHNFLLVTERCNSNCLMCSQPPRDRDDIEYLFGIHSQLIPLIPKECKALGITGGEPTLLGSRFIELLRLIKGELPNTELQVLTNGRSFCSADFVNDIADLRYDKLILCVPLYADYYQLHDYVVQAKGAFYQTLLGLQNLARFNLRVEIRVVLHKLTIPRLTKLARFIYMNLPFVEHVALMGLEHQGYTPHNIDLLWIDPFDYRNELAQAVEFLDSFGMNVSVYNLQLCILQKRIWKHSRKSISDWKNIYLKECNSCAVKNECGGFFASTENFHSSHITPLIAPQSAYNP